jgi:hypothetical protein
MKRISASDAVFRNPPCAACGKPMRLMRREPHSKLGPTFELHTFECPSCGHVETEDVGPTE